MPCPGTGLRAACLILAAAATASSAAEPATDRPAPAEGRPNIVLIVMDTARRDHFSTYGYEKETTPSFSRFAEGSILFDRAYSTSAWTVPAHASLFTGLYPASHGANQETQRLADGAVTLAEILSDAGYQTASFSGNPWISSLANLAQGYDKAEVFWSSRAQPEEGKGLPHAQNRKALRWVDERDPTRPFLLFVNYIEAHWRYQAPPEFQRRFVPGGREVSQEDDAMFPAQRGYLAPERVPTDLIPVRTGMYDADLAFTDAILGELLDGLRERDLLEGALVIITSDHGENHGDNGHFAHMLTLNEPVLRVPLAVRPPGGEGAGTVRDDPVQLGDLFATALTAAGVALPELPLPVHDVLAGPVPADREILAEYYYPNQVLDSFPKRALENPNLRPYLRRIRTLITGGDKLTWGSDGRVELYDLAADPAESRDVRADRPERSAALEARLDALLTRCRTTMLVPGEDEEQEMTPEEEERLRALGYVR
ncbi:MAG TPA: sulfatase [bacterium]|nr:sulfatase [bacterium]